MVTTMRPDIDSRDECVRNTTSRTFAVVACTLGIPMLLPFLRAVCKSKKSSQTRHTGFKIVQQIAILMGNAILPHLTSLVEIVESGLEDQHGNNRIMSALAVAALAEASTPYGIESFDTILRPLWLNIRKCRGKVLAGFLKAAGCLIPLMETKFASCYTREIMPIIIREFRSPDSEMKCILLKLVKQCCCTADGLDVLYIKEELLPHFFEHFWTYRIEPNQRTGRQLTDTTVAIACKIGTYDILNRLVDHLKDENEKVRQMAMVTISKIMEHVGAGDIDAQLEEQLFEGILYTFQEQSNSNRTILTAFSTIVTQLGKRVKPYLPQISDIIMWRLNNKCSLKRQQSADLISYIAAVIKQCNDLKLLNYLAVVLFENLGEEYPDVLGSILGALKSILNVMAMSTVTPMLKYLLHRLLPILKNRHEKVQENCVSLVGLIAQIAPEYVSAHEWLRVCFELLELFKSHNKSVRHTAINTFGYIARAIGPNDILLMLLNSLKVQQRRYRICSSVAIAVLAETCQPFTVLPSLVNEYRVREQNVRNGVLKSLSFMFKYIGAMANDYVYAVSPLLEDALQDRDLVHRQLACNAIKHISLGVNGMGREDVLIHLMNYVWPNIFETSPHLSLAFQEAIGALRVALGPTKILQYLLQGLFHSSRKVRKAYWNIYNMVYVGAQDALVAGYPRIVNDSRNRYIRYELDYNL
uniref:Phosphatase PP2A regulatory subunit A/Splicing factor 3B subunit 1-like HEAT repeat domain-containing protein n=1 Tax=Anopheles maculatus TaxID=74869 RepID=A0A182SX53_9DIPT